MAASAASPAHERERRGALQQFLELFGTRLVGGALGQRVLDYPQRGVGLGQPPSQLRHLLHGDAAVVDREHGLGLLDLGGHLVDDR